VNEYGICNATLAFNLVSGRLDRLFELLSPTGIEPHLAEKDLYRVLSRHLSNLEDAFHLNASQQVEEGILDFRIPISRLDTGDYLPKLQECCLTLWPEIQHGIIDGID